MNDKWGVTHCSVCGKRKLTESDVAAWEARYEAFGVTFDEMLTPEQSKTLNEASDVCCWATTEEDCMERFTANNGLRPLVESLGRMRERIDELEAQMKELKTQVSDLALEAQNEQYAGHWNQREY